jgi:hypothetical protein
MGLAINVCINLARNKKMEENQLKLIIGYLLTALHEGKSIEAHSQGLAEILKETQSL